MVGRTDSRSDEQRADDAVGPSRWITGGGRPLAGLSGNPAEVWSRYHCPVCGHQDRVTLSGPPVSIECSHCRTLLVVSLPKAASETASVRVDLDLSKS